jgi:hypothetical protein
MTDGNEVITDLVPVKAVQYAGVIYSALEHVPPTMMHGTDRRTIVERTRSIHRSQARGFNDYQCDCDCGCGCVGVVVCGCGCVVVDVNEVGV